MGQIRFRGIPFIEGLGIAKVKLFNERSAVWEQRIAPEQQEEERLRLHELLASYSTDIQRSIERKEWQESVVDLWESFLQILEDEEVLASLEAYIAQNYTCAHAFSLEGDRQYSDFMSLSQAYLRERADDVRALFYTLRDRAAASSEELATHGSGLVHKASSEAAPIILVAEALRPSDLLNIPDIRSLRGVVTCGGSHTSHITLLLKSFSIPYLGGVEDLSAFRDGDLLILDALEGTLILNPVQELYSRYLEAQAKQEELRQELEAYRSLSIADYSEGRLQLLANVSSSVEAQEACQRGCDGIGLVRSEFFFMGREEMPSEEEQFLAYREILRSAAGRPCTIRTLDVGGDKDIPYLQLPQEKNPFLGFRGIRVTLGRPTIFRVQLRAILRAAAYGPLKIMFPFISRLDEMEEAIALTRQEFANLRAVGEGPESLPPLGCMIETPAAVLLAAEFAKIADFFSIGSNDLIQYLLCVSRENTALASAYESQHPAVLCALERVLQAGKLAGIEVSVCGDIASLPTMIDYLRAWGVSALSVAIPQILPVKKYIHNGGAA